MISQKRWKFNFDENRFALKRVFCCCYSLGMHINCAFVKHSYKTNSIGVISLQLTKMLSVLKLYVALDPQDTHSDSLKMKDFKLLMLEMSSYTP